MDVSVGAKAFNEPGPNAPEPAIESARETARPAERERASDRDAPATRVTLSEDAQAVVEASRVRGTADDDRLIVRGNDADVAARAGDDVVRVVGDEARARGGRGDDAVVARGDRNKVRGGRGDDAARVVGDASTVRGGAGDDRVGAVGDDDRAVGGRGDDTVFARGDGNRLGGGRGDDDVVARGDENRVNGGDGDDRVVARGDDNVLKGGRGGDRIIARGDGNRIDAGSGDDVVRVTGGDAIVNAGTGDDRVRTDAGDDLVRTGSGDDRIVTGAGDDRVVVNGQGAKRIDLGEGNDTVRIRGAVDDFTFRIVDDRVTAVSRTDPETRIVVTGAESLRFDGGVEARITASGDLETADGSRLAAGRETDALVTDLPGANPLGTGVALRPEPVRTSEAASDAGPIDAEFEPVTDAPRNDVASTATARETETVAAPAPVTPAADDARRANERPIFDRTARSDSADLRSDAPDAFEASGPAKRESVVEGVSAATPGVSFDPSAWTPNRAIADALSEIASVRAEENERVKDRARPENVEGGAREGARIDVQRFRDEVDAGRSLTGAGFTAADISRAIGAYAAL